MCSNFNLTLKIISYYMITIRWTFNLFSREQLKERYVWKAKCFQRSWKGECWQKITGHSPREYLWELPFLILWPLNKSLSCCTKLSFLNGSTNLSRKELWDRGEGRWEWFSLSRAPRDGLTSNLVTSGLKRE